MNVSIDVATGHVNVRYSETDGSEKVLSDHLHLPPDIANGIVFTLLKNLGPGTQKTTLSMIAATPKARIVKLVISANGEESFATGRIKRKATHYIVKVEIGGVAGLVAPIIGKQPPDTQVWVLHDQVPTFVRSEGPLFEGGPIWRIDLINPTWPK